MKLLVCTANQPRHVTLVKRLIQAGHDVVTIVEPKSYVDNKKYGRYWEYVREAELDVFGRAFLMPGSVMCMRPGELSGAPDYAGVFMEERLPVVFSSSYIVPPVIDWFIAAGAINLHVGLAPFYRGSAPNFWAAYDKNHHLVGAQIQRLSKNLDAGTILAETREIDTNVDPFKRGMLAAAAGIELLVNLLETPAYEWVSVTSNDSARQIRYSRHSDFTPEVASEFLERYGL